MNDSAQVTSIAGLEAFHAALCRFRTDATEALAAVDGELRRAVDWLHDQLKYWQKEIRGRQDDVVQARIELNRRKNSRILDRIPDCTEQEDVLREAQRQLEEAEEKLANCRRWGPLLQQAVDEYQAPARQLAGFLDANLPCAIALMDRKITALDSYVAVSAAANRPPSARTAPEQAQGNPGQAVAARPENAGPASEPSAQGGPS